MLLDLTNKIRKLARRMSGLVMMSLIVSSAIAADNSIYIHQAGDNTAVTVVQDGVSNVVRGIQGSGSGNATPADIIGDSIVISISQTGTGNTLDFGINTSIANINPLTSGNTFNYMVYGNNNQGIVDSNNNGAGSSVSNYVDINQAGNNNIAHANVLGTNNTIATVTSGGNNNTSVGTVNGGQNIQSLTVSGGDNIVAVNQGVGGTALLNTSLNLSGETTASYNTNGTSTTTITGVSNTVGIQQTSSAYDNTTTVVLNGNSNSATIVQNAVAANTIVNLNSAGNSNTFNIHSNAH